MSNRPPSPGNLRGTGRQWSIDSLATTARYEPGLRSVFLEGATDVSIVLQALEGYFHGNVPSHIGVYEIDSVNVPDEIIDRNKVHHSGKKARVVSLALELAKKLPPESNSITCIADIDLDALMARSYASPYLLMTDFSSIDMYFFDESTISKYLRIIHHANRLDPKKILVAFKPVLKELFIIRGAKERFGFPWVSIKNFLLLKHGSITLDRAGYVRAVTGGRAKDVATFEEEASRVEMLNPNGVPNWSHHADFGELFSWYLQVKGFGRNVFDKKVLFGCKDFTELFQYPTFSNLITRLKP